MQHPLRASRPDLPAAFAERDGRRAEHGDEIVQERLAWHFLPLIPGPGWHAGERALDRTHPGEQHYSNFDRSNGSFIWIDQTTQDRRWREVADRPPPGEEGCTVAPAS